MAGLFHVMGGDEYGHSLAWQLFDETPEALSGNGVHTGSGFIQKKYVGVVEQGTA
jgi:hypothetical protein